MIKSFLEIMDTSEESVREFTAACNDLVNSKYILSDMKITAVLQRLAKSKLLYLTLENCMRGFKFRIELDKTRVVDGNGVERIVMPRERKTFVALAFCLLYSFDTKQTPLKRFLDTYYTSEISINNQYEEFCHAIVKPFAQKILEEYLGEPDPELEMSSTSPVEPEQKPIKVTVNDDGVTALTICVNKMMHAISLNIMIDDSEREALSTLCESFKATISTKSRESIINIYSGFKSAMADSSFAEILDAERRELKELIIGYVMN